MDLISQPVPKPRCAVCGHEVERFSVERDPFKSEFIMVAECHGDREVVAIGDNTIVGAEHIGFGLAFNSKKLDAGTKLLP